MYQLQSFIYQADFKYAKDIRLLKIIKNQLNARYLIKKKQELEKIGQ